jgi:hypothetical protein
MEEAQKLPPIKVLICGSYGGFDFSEGFTAFVHSHMKLTDINRDSLRSDPALIEAISDYGRFICDKYPFILNDMRIVDTWKLDKLLDNLDQLPMKETEFDADLVTEAMSFHKQMSDSNGHWREDCLGSFPKSKRLTDFNTPDLEAFTEKNPDFWMAHRSMDNNSFGPPTFKIALRFAHVLLKGDDHARYHVEPDEARDAAIYEHIGRGASSRYGRLVIVEIPALVDFSIHTYDGLDNSNHDSRSQRRHLHSHLLPYIRFRHLTHHSHRYRRSQTASPPYVVLRRLLQLPLRLSSENLEDSTALIDHFVRNGARGSR